MQLLQEAGLPDGVINLVYGSGATIGDAALASPELAGIHFTGSTPRLPEHVEDGRREHRQLPQLPADRRRDRRQGLHPRALESADVDAVATAIVRGSFEYQGQKCSAASRVYAP